MVTSYKIWSWKPDLQRRLQGKGTTYKTDSIRLSWVSNLRCSGCLVFRSLLRRQKLFFDQSQSLGLKSGSDFHQKTVAKDLQGTRVVDIQTFAQGLEECLFCKRGKYE